MASDKTPSKSAAKKAAKPTRYLTLRRGDQSEKVRELQAHLNERGLRDQYGSALVESGIFDSRTEAAVALYQGKWGMKPTGEVDFVTATSLAFSKHLRIEDE